MGCAQIVTSTSVITAFWDTNELYDLKEDPNEMHNLIAKPELQDTIKRLNHDLYNWMESTGGMFIPLKRTEDPHGGPQEYGKILIFTFCSCLAEYVF